MVANYGMSGRLGPVYYDHDAEHPFLGQRVALASGTSASTLAVIEEEARTILGRQLEEATRMLEARRPQLDGLCAELLERESLEREDIGRLLGPRAPSPQ
jgi:cell division protease FtsH